jgi:hypothetical protein
MFIVATANPSSKCLNSSNALSACSHHDNISGTMAGVVRRGSGAIRASAMRLAICSLPCMAGSLKDLTRSI